ncbi:hypothetical protein [Gordonia soli]|uniref:hypothetical protein n=1 Tax=Gordonia soli TaxID=320799 RepID=UPI001FE11B7D|nr:hypothetical protein [Gordonia soli]
MTRVRRSSVVGALAASVVVIACACGAVTEGPTPASSTSAAPTTSQRLNSDQCRETPPKGQIDRSGSELRFHKGSIRVALDRIRPAADAPQANQANRTSVDTTDCLGFPRWGSPAPDVPPDTLLFVFKGPGTDGAQIEFNVGDLTGGVLPPVGPVRPTVGPLDKPIGATIGASVDGAYYQASRCSLSISAMSKKKAAASFTCPATTRSDSNPLAPDDDVSHDDPTESSTATGTSTGPTTKVVLSGWFSVEP